MVVDATFDSLSSLLERLAADHDVGWIVVIGEPCIVPKDHLQALDALTDQRVRDRLVPVECRRAAQLPVPWTPVPWVLGGATPDALTSSLRRYEPAPALPPVPVAAGPIVAFSASVVRMLPAGWDHGARSWGESVAGFSLAAQAAGC